MPRRFSIYCDAVGGHYVLVEPRAALWLALKLECRTLCLLSAANLGRMQLIGHCALTP